MWEIMCPISKNASYFLKKKLIFYLLLKEVLFMNVVIIQNLVLFLISFVILFFNFIFHISSVRFIIDILISKKNVSFFSNIFDIFFCFLIVFVFYFRNEKQTFSY